MMKKWLCIIICLITAFCFAGCKEEVDPNEPPLVELIAKSITDKHEITIVDDEGTVWLKNEDISSVCIMFKNGQNRYLELRFTEDGEEKFEDAIDESKDGIVSIKLDGEVLVKKVTANEKTPEYARADSKYEDVIGWFNELT